MSEINDWDKVAANNNDAPPNGWPENMNYSEVNNAAREGMSAHARLYADMNGTLVTAGAANAYTLTSNRTLSAYASGLGFIFKANHTNTGAATIDVNSLGVKDIKNIDGSALSANHLVQNRYYQVFYQGIYFVLMPRFSHGEVVEFDPSGRVGIGISSPTDDLHVYGGAVESLVEGTNDTLSTLVAGVSVKAPFYRKAGITIYDESDNEDFFIGRPYASANEFAIVNDGSERVRIDSTGKVGIGTGSPSAGLHVVNNNFIGEDIAIFEAETTKNGYVYINGDEDRRKAIVFQSVGVDKFSMGVSDSDEISPVRFYIASGKSGGHTSLLNIKDDGDVSIGTTLTPTDLAGTSSVEGFATGTDGRTAISRSAGVALYLNRLSTHGIMLSLRFAGVTAGQISSVAADSIAIGSGDTGLRFEDTGKRVQPFDVNSGLNSDGLIDLGYTNKQFKDVYISGSIYKDSEDIQTLPQNTKNQAYTFALSDIGKSVYHSNGTAYTWTIPPNSTTAFPIGAAITLINDASGAVDITIARGSGVALILGGDGTDQNCTLARYGVATIIKVGTDKWYCSGNGVS